MRAASLAFLGLLLVLGAACGGDEDGDGRYSSMLRLAPDQPAFREGITIVDFEAIRALPGYELARPFGQADEEADADPNALRNALGWHGIGGVPLGLFGEDDDTMTAMLENLESGFGIGLDEISQALTAGVVPPRNLYVLTGNFDPDSIEQQLEVCTDCVPGDRLEYEGQSFFSWGGDIQTQYRLRPPAFDLLGRGGNVSFTDDYIIRSNFVDELEASLDASQGKNVLLDDESFRLLAETLDRHEFVATHVGDRQYDREFARQFLDNTRRNTGGVEIGEAWDLPDDAVLPTAYEAFAIGAGIENDEPYTLVLLAYATEAEAAENVDRFRERLSTGLSEPGRAFSDVFTSTEVTVDGRLLVATLRGQARFAIRFGIEPLLLHE